MTAAPTWITLDDVLAFHDMAIRKYGGLAGVRDMGLVESAIVRPQHVHRYETQDLLVLAATYAHGLVKNHGFVDGNKRTAMACSMTFMGINDLPFKGDPAEAVVMVEGLAASKVDRDTFADWLRKMA